MSRLPHALLVLALAIVLGGPARGDVLFLANGGRLEGELLNPDESPRETYVLKTPFGGRLTLDEEQVERVEFESQAERSYAAVLPGMPDTLEAHWDMAQRCEQAGLAEQQEFHLEQVLRHDPDHEGARHALGFSRIDGRWRRQEDWMERQGYVRHRGGWRLAQEVELEALEQEHEERIVSWRKSLRTWRGWIVKDRERRSRGEHEIRMIRDPLAAAALADLLADEKEPRQLKLLYVDVLGDLPSNVALDALIKHALSDRDPKVRDACLDELSRTGSRRAVEAFSGALQHEKNYMVHRAAVALSAMNDPAATLPLIDALITEHKRLVGGGGIRPGFSNQGSGLSFGGNPKIEEIKFKNDPVLHALNALHPGVNFGFNQEAWKNWYIARHTPPPVDLRRSP